MGVCQAQMPACNGCAVSIFPKVDCEHDAENLSHTPFDAMAYWACIVAVSLATLVVLCGGAGYLYGWLG